MTSAHLHPQLLVRSPLLKSAERILPASNAAADSMSMSCLRALQASPMPSPGASMGIHSPALPHQSSPSSKRTRLCRALGLHVPGDGVPRSSAVRGSVTAAAAASAAATVAPKVGLQMPLVVEAAPIKHTLPSRSPPDSLHQSGHIKWPFASPAVVSPSEEIRRSIVKSAPQATTAELSTAAKMARLSSLAYYPDPSDRLEALGLELKECQQTPYTAFFIADGPSNLSGLSSGKGAKEGENEGKTRYIIARGVAFDRAEVRIGDLWSKLLRFLPTEFERGLTPHGADLLVHEGVKEIADQVYQSLLPFLAIDPKRDGITAVRFGGHSLGGSLAQLLMLMFHLRSPVTRGYSIDLDCSAHTFGSFPVVSSALHLPWGDQNEHCTDHSHDCALLRTLSSLGSHIIMGPEDPKQWEEPGCSVMETLGLPAGASQGFVLDSDIIPRAFQALKFDAVRGFFNLRERMQGGQRSLTFPSTTASDPGIFKPLGRVNLMHTQGSEVSVASLQPRLAEKALHVDVDEFIRNPSLIVKSIQDHYFNHYVSRLDSALAASRLEGQD